MNILFRHQRQVNRSHTETKSLWRKSLLTTLLFLSLIPYSFPVFAVTDSYYFTSPEKQIRFQRLTDELRCLVCQNQSLSDSNAPLAQDLRAELARLLNQGKSDPEIIHYLVQRYGNFVLFRPPLDKATLILWLGPFLLLLMGAGFLWFRISRGLSEAPISNPDLESEIH